MPKADRSEPVPKRLRPEPAQVHVPAVPRGVVPRHPEASAGCAQDIPVKVVFAQKVGEALEAQRKGAHAVSEVPDLGNAIQDHTLRSLVSTSILHLCLLWWLRRSHGEVEQARSTQRAGQYGRGHMRVAAAQWRPATLWARKRDALDHGAGRRRVNVKSVAVLAQQGTLLGLGP